jgi:histone deacetylase 6
MLDRTVNIPWPCGGIEDKDYLYAFQKIIMPIAFEFAPDFVIGNFPRDRPIRRNAQFLSYTVSAGFDAAMGDPLGECKVSPAGYAHMTYMLSSLANGRLVLALEVILSLELTEGIRGSE